ncbi:MAG: AzlC family ABC transporter permease [Lachnospiraceae bacterium]|nr:AzlC family ABC transporter permease [Lachnospiraceae bacterium]
MRHMTTRECFFKGMRDGLPVGAGYFAVSFSLGIMASLAGIRPLQGFFMSLFTNASAGEYAGIRVILEDAGYLSMVLMTITASARYFLMSAALSQKVRPGLSFGHRLLIAFDITDEIFALSTAVKGYVRTSYIYGLFIAPLIGWSTGTAAGMIMGDVLPAIIVTALSVSLYGMFIAIIIPPARKEKPVLIGVTVAFIASYVFSRLPYVRELSSGTRTIILTVIIAGILAFLAPVKEEVLEDEEEAESGAGKARAAGEEGES